MNYIRTKDGIYELMFPEESKMSFDHKTIEPAYYSINHEWIAKRDVIKPPTDNIEELFDFIFVKDEYGDYRLYDLRDWKNTDKEYLKESWINGWLKELYYCIKTDKGLIFVAKMNNKGEPELI